ncbi:CRISPR-associated protein Cas5 family [Carbonactinospora thermoautotrophica]|uniref:CRISPR-associated protein Cas5 family n=1 Tax=Carbonactinospora thermoautotrophica TaxID=1469144 RepID=A0A132MYM8_9ACTN|nr:type I-E CRISPR-associated protein Cas5/CasD [Carbonactinospora thermoautotrophica]KWX02917.1 CRISPR-associated protein Cas5 family [Carbonactinospora thermoautotrophica]
MAGLILRLAGPLQSWGEHSTFQERDTQPYPTRSGILGLLAAAQGRSRASELTDFLQLRLTVRVDRPGVFLTDFHTVGGGLPRHQTIPTAEGGRRPEKATTLVSRRHYLADAAFTVAVEGPDELTGKLAAALRHPVWPLYLGRRSCPPAEPILLAAGVADPVAALKQAVPLSRARPREQSTVAVDFVYETDIRDPHARTHLLDVPVSFDPLRRTYRPRAIKVRTEQLPAELCCGRGVDQMKALATYATRISQEEE